jgi:hypothetical protein
MAHADPIRSDPIRVSASAADAAGVRNASAAAASAP